MTTFTEITLIRETIDGGEFAGYEQRAVILRSRGSLHGRAFGAFGRWFDAQRKLPNCWTICDISEFPDRFTFDHITGGF